jgi:hypothetical protein
VRARRVSERSVGTRGRAYAGREADGCGHLDLLTLAVALVDRPSDQLCIADRCKVTWRRTRLSHLVGDVDGRLDAR